MNKGKWAVTHASTPLAEALLECMAEQGIDSEDVILLDTELLSGKRLSYGDTYIETQDQMEFDYENLDAILLLEQDSELEDLLQHADCFVISHYFDADAEPVYSPDSTCATDWSKPKPVKLANAELSTLLNILTPLRPKYKLTSLQMVNILSVSFFGKPAVDELATQTIGLLNSQKPENQLFPLQLAFNMQPVVTATGMENQLSELLGGSVNCSIQNMLVPAFHGMASSVTLTFKSSIELDAIIAQINKIKGIKVSAEAVSPMSHCQTGSTIYLSMVKRSEQDSRVLQFWMVADSAKNGLVQNYFNSINSISQSK